MKLLVTEGAFESYHAAMAFLSDLLTEQQLDRLDDLLWARITMLKERPHMGAYEDLLHHPEHRYRRIVVRKFKVIYWIDGDTVVVTDIFDARQDPKRMKG